MCHVTVRTVKLSLYVLRISDCHLAVSAENVISINVALFSYEQLKNLLVKLFSMVGIFLPINRINDCKTSKCSSINEFPLTSPPTPVFVSQLLVFFFFTHLYE